MTKARDITKALDYLKKRGAITGWVEGTHSRYQVTTADGKSHSWSSGQVLSFWAGVYAGINLERKKVS